jgi:transcriptional regulator with PAS, ATPase and Fis domain
LQPASAAAARPAPKAAAALKPSVVLLDPKMRDLYALAARIARGDISVLLLGETGAGKDVLAEAIHAASPRAARAMVKLNCAAFSEQLLESELFGHEKGAFTGAAAAKQGLLEVADGGTAFLDEVGELTAPMQAKLLRALEEGRVLRVGGTRPRPIDVRFVAATNRDLLGEVERGAFRRDLYFRLSAVCLAVPPLRERPAELLPLARAFLARACERLGRPALELSPAAIPELTSRPWPGNVRELRNAMERAALVCDGAFVGPEHLAAAPGQAAAPPSAQAREETLRAEMEALEKRRILDALERCGGNQTRAAELLGMPRRTLVKRLGQYGIR